VDLRILTQLRNLLSRIAPGPEKARMLTVTAPDQTNAAAQ